MSTHKYWFSKFIYKRQNIGFTLVEMLVVVAIMAILTTIASPYLLAFPANSRLDERAQSLSAQIQNARSEAIRTNNMVYVCALLSDTLLRAEGCSKTPHDWGSGAMVFSDILGKFKVAGDYAANEKLSATVFDKKVSISDNMAGNKKELVFLPNGRERDGLEVDFALIDNASKLCRGVLLNPSGRTSICKKGEDDCANICA